MSLVRDECGEWDPPRQEEDEEKGKGEEEEEEDWGRIKDFW